MEKFTGEIRRIQVDPGQVYSQVSWTKTFSVAGRRPRGSQWQEEDQRSQNQHPITAACI